MSMYLCPLPTLPALQRKRGQAIARTAFVVKHIGYNAPAIEHQCVSARRMDRLRFSYGLLSAIRAYVRDHRRQAADVVYLPFLPIAQLDLAMRGPVVAEGCLPGNDDQRVGAQDPLGRRIRCLSRG